MKIAVIGSGISGLSAAHYLSKKYKVDLIEQEDRFGGHSYTYDIKVIYKFGDRFSVDAAFERYEMEGKDETPQSAFSDADVLTLGASLWF